MCFPSPLQWTLEEVFQLSAFANCLGHLQFPYFIPKRDHKKLSRRALREIILIATFNCFCWCFDRFNDHQRLWIWLKVNFQIYGTRFGGVSCICNCLLRANLIYYALIITVDQKGRQRRAKTPKTRFSFSSSEHANWIIRTNSITHNKSWVYRPWKAFSVLSSCRCLWITSAQIGQSSASFVKNRSRNTINNLIWLRYT